MPSVAVVELTELLPSMPDMEAYVPTAEDAARIDDVFLCALGFEERCLAIPEALADSGYRARRAFYLQYETNPEDNKTNFTLLADRLSTISNEVQSIRLDDPESAKLLRIVLDSFPADYSPSITFDLSVVSNRFIVRVLHELFSHHVRLRLVYSEAASYHPTREEYEADKQRWTTDPHFGTEHGVAEIVTLSEFPGGHFDPLPDFVIVFPSFKPDRGRAVVNHVDPSLYANPRGKVLWILGIPHLEENRWRLEAMRAINELGIDAFQMDVSTFDYKEALKTLEIAYNQRSTDHNITVAVFGSKLQALATCLFCLLHPDVRIISAKPVEYGVQFSRGCRAMWKINFGETGAIMDLLASVGELRVV